MATTAILRTVLAGGTLALLALAGFLYINPISQDSSVSVMIISLGAINLALLYFVLKYLMVDQADFFLKLIEKIPGVNASTPVPKHLIPKGAKNALQVEQPKPIATAETEVQQPINTLHNTDDYPSIDSIDAELAAIMEEQPFTLGTVQSETAEIKQTALYGSVQTKESAQVKAPHKANLGMDLSREHTTPIRKSTTSNKQIQLQRFFDICQQLKQMNEEVAVWTEGELATLGNTMLTPRSKDKDMVALLLPQRVARITLNKTFEFEFHAQVLRSIILATGTNLPVTFVYSSKVELTGQCEVNFEYNRKPISWRFIEPENALSKRFLKNALEWIGQRAGGKFYDVSDNDIICSYVFVSNQIANQLTKTERVQARA